MFESSLCTARSGSNSLERPARRTSSFKAHHPCAQPSGTWQCLSILLKTRTNRRDCTHNAELALAGVRAHERPIGAFLRHLPELKIVTLRLHDWQSGASTLLARGLHCESKDDVNSAERRGNVVPTLIREPTVCGDRACQLAVHGLMKRYQQRAPAPKGPRAGWLVWRCVPIHIRPQDLHEQAQRSSERTHDACGQ